MRDDLVRDVSLDPELLVDADKGLDVLVLEPVHVHGRQRSLRQLGKQLLAFDAVAQDPGSTGIEAAGPRKTQHRFSAAKMSEGFSTGARELEKPLQRFKPGIHLAF